MDNTDTAHGPHHGIHHQLLQRIAASEDGQAIAPAYIVRVYWTDAILFRGPFASYAAARAWADRHEPLVNIAQPAAAQAFFTVHPLDDGRWLDELVVP